MYELVFINGPRAGEPFRVNGPFVSGRSPDCGLEVPDPNASRQHAHFIFDGTHLTVADNRSANGTFVNETRIAAPTVLHANDVVRLGETKLKVVTHGAQKDDGGNSSIFAFRDAAEGDLGASLVMSMDEARDQVLDPDALRARLNAIQRVSTALVRIDQIDAVLAEILSALFEVFPQADRGFLMLGKDPEAMVPRAVKERKPGGPPPTASRSLCANALAKLGAVLWQEGGGADFAAGMSLVGLSIRHAMAVALVAGDEPLGVLQIDTTDARRAFTKDDLALAAAVASQAAIALHNAFLLQKTERDAAMRTNLLRFLPGPLAEQARSGAIDVGLGGRSYQGTVLFSDVIGFTAMSERLTPEQVIAVMNAYFDSMVRAVQNDGGAIDKFIGDAIMAFWGIPPEKEGAADHARSGIASALAMQTLLVGFNSERQAAGESPLAHGIGLNTGAVVAGNIGSQASTISYTLLGDTVNTASRIEHAAMAGQVLASRATWDAANGAFGVRMPPLVARNKAEPVEVFSVRGLVQGTEILLHVPVRIGGASGLLVRRLADRSFVLLYPPGTVVADATVEPVLPEWPCAAVGSAAPVENLPVQVADGRLVRIRITLPDPTLGGLLSTEPPVCPVGWDQLVR